MSSTEVDAFAPRDLVNSTASQNQRSDAATTADPDWTPLIVTPPFPSYTSGHSTFSSAAATVLASFFGTDDIAFTTSSDALPGVSRSFASFSAAAEEAGRSRIYGGIHWEFDNGDGLRSGRQLGLYAFENFLEAKDEEGERRRARHAVAIFRETAEALSPSGDLLSLPLGRDNHRTFVPPVREPVSAAVLSLQRDVAEAVEEHRIGRQRRIEALDNLLSSLEDVEWRLA